MNTTQVMKPQEVRDLQTIVPEWMEKVLVEAESQGKDVEVERCHTPFGTYTMSVKIHEAEEVIDLSDYVADIVEIGYEQNGEADFDEALRIFCDRRKKPATITNIELVEQRFRTEFKGEGKKTFAFDF